MTPETKPDTPATSHVDTIIRSRRSIKPSQFSNERIADELVWKMLRNAGWAPNHGKTEPWRFFVFTDAAKNEFGNYLAQLYTEITPASEIKPSKVDKLISNAERSSHLIVIAMKRQESKKIPEIEEIEAVACAVQNLHLTATAHGLGGYWSSGKTICNDQLRQHLGLGSDDRVLGLFYLGHTDITWPDGFRSPIESKVVWKS